MSEAITLSLGGREFEVPRLPLGVTILVYPICQRLTNGGLAERLLKADAQPLNVSAEEIADLTEIAFQAAHAADDTLDVKAFLALPVTPPELFAAFFVMRIQCGGWSTRKAEDGDEPGEGEGARPPTSTSTESSPSSSDISTSPSTTG